MHIPLLSILPLLALTTASSLLPRQTSSRQCNPSNLCYQQLTPSSSSKPLFRVALPDTPSSPPYDTILEIVAPNALSWTGFAWGGSMVNNPLTLAWPDGETGKVVISSRWASGRTLPSTYSSATYTTLRSSRNSTHWSVELACSGCSRWTGKQLATDSTYQFAWASCNKRSGVAQPGNAGSRFEYHTDVGYWPAQLAGARNAAGVFQSYVKAGGKSG